MKEINKMEFKELLEWAQQADWDVVTNEQWKDYEARCKKLAPKYFQPLNMTELEAFYKTYSGDGVDPWFEAWTDSLLGVFPFSEIFDNLRALEKSVKVLLKENENQPANITIGQLNRLKGGI